MKAAFQIFRLRPSETVNIKDLGGEVTGRSPLLAPPARGQRSREPNPDRHSQARNKSVAPGDDVPFYSAVNQAAAFEVSPASIDLPPCGGARRSPFYGPGFMVGLCLGEEAVYVFGATS